jgi:hypothetical protein
MSGNIYIDLFDEDVDEDVFRQPLGNPHKRQKTAKHKDLITNLPAKDLIE